MFDQSAPRPTCHVPEIEPMEARLLLSAVHFAAIGDYGGDTANEAAVAAEVKSWNPQFIVTVGDNTYTTPSDLTKIDATIGKYYHDYINNYPGSYGAGSATERFFPAMGNHDWDVSDTYLSYFTLPGNERYYDFAQGPVHFFIVDSDTREPDGTSPTSVQGQWLKARLAAATEPWKLVVFHHAPYTSARNPLSSTWMQWPFAAWGASAVLTGHAHLYEALSEGGLPYFIDGLGGAPPTHSFGPSIAGDQVRYNAGPGAMLIDASDTVITFRFITTAGATIDTSTLTRAEAPFNGSAAGVPGTIQAENFDNGGDGVAWHDLNVNNNGLVYRSTPIDVEPCADTGGGFDVGWNQPSEWLKYTVTAPTTGTYNLDLRAAYNGVNVNGGTAHVEVDGTNVTGSITLPKTGGWQKWQTVSKAGINLSAGQHVLRLVFDHDGAGSTASTAYLANINWLRLSAGAQQPQQPFPGPGLAPVPSTMQAENFDTGGEGVAWHDLTAANAGGKYRTTSVDVEVTADTGGGYDVGWNQPGEWLEYSTNVATTGTYTLDIRTAYGGTNASGGTIHVEVDGVDVTGAITLTKTGGWQTWQTVSKTGISLSAGTHVLRLAFDKDGAGSTASTAYLGNINWMRLTTSS